MPRARTSSAHTIHARLAAGAAKLRQAGADDEANAIDEILAPSGWGLLRRAEAAANPERAGERNLAIPLPKDIRDEIKARAAANGDVITRVVNEGFEKYLAGKFTPKQPQRSAWGSGEVKANLNVRPSGELRDRVEQEGPLALHVAGAYLMHKYGLGPYAPDSDTTAAE